MRDLLFPSSPVLTGELRAAAWWAGRAFVMECRAICGMFEAAEPEQREFVAGEVACVLHVAPATGAARLGTALDVMAQPRLVAALEQGRIGVGHALAMLGEVAGLEPRHAAAVLDAVLGRKDGTAVEDGSADAAGSAQEDELPVGAGSADGVGSAVEDGAGIGPGLGLTPGELRAACRRAAVVVDPAAARRRHERAQRTAGVVRRPGADGMGQLVVDATATQVATAWAAIDGRAAAMAFEDPDLTVGQRRLAALLHALGCDRTRVQAVLERPVEKAVDVHAVAHASVWTVDVRMPVAVALGLSDHPAVLSGYGPIGADQARALLPAADLVRACVDASTGEVLSVDAPVRAESWTKGCPDRTRALRQELLRMATCGATLPELRTDGYVPSAALGRLVDLRDVTSVFPGDSTPVRRCDRDHRLPYPLDPTDPTNLQNTARRWHRAKHTGWHTSLLPDGNIGWTSPSGGRYLRRPKRTDPPEIPPRPPCRPCPERERRRPLS